MCVRAHTLTLWVVSLLTPQQLCESQRQLTEVSSLAPPSGFWAIELRSRDLTAIALPTDPSVEVTTCFLTHCV